MCGIVGYIGAEARTQIERMNASQCHRGPDSGDFHFDATFDLAIGMRRLAILDLAGGEQPMTSPDGRYVIVYNGEIFNSPELKRDLENQGVVFQTDHSDTEVLFHLLIREGKAALSKLNGMFGFAFLDKKRGKLLLARDRFGIKPLYYSETGTRFAFASEIKSLSAMEGFQNRLNRSALYDYLSLQYVVGQQSIVDGVKRLSAGHCLEYDLSAKTYHIEKWWSPSYQPQSGVSRTEWVERVRDGLEKAVMRWSLSDVPLAISLSGGLDSSAIAGICAKNGIKLQAYSLGFEGEGEEDWNELPLARKVAEKWDLSYNETVLKPEAILDSLEDMVAALDEPYGGGLPSWFIYSAMAGQVKVAHTGTGGDEMFGNYGKWQMLEGRLLGRLRLAKSKSVTFHDFQEKFFDRYYYFGDAAKQNILSDDFRACEATAQRFYDLFQATQTSYLRDGTGALDISTQLPDEFLHMTDRFSMAHSIEARTPFLDNDFTDLVRTIPASQRTHRKDLKGLLREAVTPYLPEELLNAPKKGFVIPLGLWMRHQLRNVVEELLGPDHLKKQGLFSERFYTDYVVPHLSGQADHTNKLWTVLMFQLWSRRYG